VAGIVLSRWTGTLVDKHPKLALVRTCILIQKLSAAIAYGAFTVLFSFQQQPPSLGDSDNTALLYFLLIIISGSALRVSTICIQIAVEKDWVIAIADGHERHLTRLNVSLRRVDLLCNLLSPLIVSVFTTALPYRTTAVFMTAVSLTTALFELYWIQVVYRAFPELARDDLRREEWKRELQLSAVQTSQLGWQASITRQYQDWSEFVRLPVFLSSLSVSLLYITVLSCVTLLIGPWCTRIVRPG
jgi:iron-regulated transporter 1